MHTPNSFDTLITKLTERELITFVMDQQFIKCEFKCPTCNNYAKLVPYKRNIDRFAWRCMYPRCIKYKDYFSLRKQSFFENLNIKLVDVLKIVIKYSVRQQRNSIKLSMDVTKNTVTKVLKKLTSLIPTLNFSTNKLGGPDSIVQIDETMLNYKCKSHRGRSPNNRTDSLCIVEVRDGIKRAFATIISNKKSETLIPIICEQVAPNSTIWTDEHSSYGGLRNYLFTHATVCHKYQFVNSETGVNTQAIESFHNELKLEIKRRKGILTESRSDFLAEFCFYFNNREDFFSAVLNLIKV
jgi:transposase-like protein